MDSGRMAEPAQAGAIQKKGISGSTIKIIAVAAMLIDHLAAVVLTRMLIDRGLFSIMGATDINQIMGWLTENSVLYYGVTIMRSIGRLGFPIFAFLLIEGFQKTRNVKKYALRLGLFALISEIPFDLAIAGTPMELSYQNVYFTLFIGILAIWAMDWFLNHELAPAVGWLLTVTGTLFVGGYTFMAFSGWSEPIYIGAVVAALLAVLGIFFFNYKRGGLARVYGAGAAMTVLIAAMLAADLLRTDYSGMGVLTIAMMYVFRKGRIKSMLAGCVVLSVMSLSEIPAFLALIPIALYNGSRGLKMKYFFYAFYPVHLLLLWLVALFMGMGWMSAI